MTILRLEIDRRIQKKKIKKFQSEIINFLFDESFNFKEVETYLELRDIYAQILFRSSRLPAKDSNSRLPSNLGGIQ